MRALLAIGLALLLSGCFDDSRDNGRFQLVTIPSGTSALVLDTRNGDLWYWTKDGDKTWFTYMGRATTQVIRYDSEGKRLDPTDDELLKKYGVSEPKSADGWTIRKVKPPPRIGDILHGYRFKGGDPADPANWEKL